MFGARTDYVGFQVEPSDCDGLRFEVVEAKAEICGICHPGTPEEPNNQAADYTIDATAILGDGGYNASYCQMHMAAVVETYGPDSGDVWYLSDGAKVGA